MLMGWPKKPGSSQGPCRGHGSHTRPLKNISHRLACPLRCQTAGRPCMCSLCRLATSFTVPKKYSVLQRTDAGRSSTRGSNRPGSMMGHAVRTCAGRGHNNLALTSRDMKGGVAVPDRQAARRSVGVSLQVLQVRTSAQKQSLMTLHTPPPCMPVCLASKHHSPRQSRPFRPLSVLIAAHRLKSTRPIAPSLVRLPWSPWSIS